MKHTMLEKTLNTFRITEVYFGGDGFRIYTPEELGQAQLGYSRHPNGTDLTGKNDGDWKGGWIVVGYDTNLGDPYFVDTTSEKLPVFTAMHGAGAWEPYTVSPALQNFLESLQHLRAHSSQEDSLVEPDDTTITDRSWIRSLEKEMNRLNAEDEFWGAFFERHVEWLKENDR